MTDTHIRNSGSREPEPYDYWSTRLSILDPVTLSLGTIGSSVRLPELVSLVPVDIVSHMMKRTLDKLMDWPLFQTLTHENGISSNRDPEQVEYICVPSVISEVINTENPSLLTFIEKCQNPTTKDLDFY